MNRYRNAMFFTCSARVGFRHLLQNLNLNKDEIILLPSYIGYSVRDGSGVMEPVEQAGIRYDFYEVKEDLSADLEDLFKKTSLHKTCAVLVIHYYGFLQSDIKKIQNFCVDNGIYLIEDCAHCLNSRYEGVLLGDYGDFSLFSIHKILPTFDGGILKLNRNDIYIPPLEENDKISFESLEIYSTSQINKISEVRINNYKFLLKLLSQSDGIEIMYPQLQDGIVPMNFPLFIKSKSRHEVYQSLMKEGVQTVALYYQLVSSIKEKEYPVSYKLSREILNLPIHQELNEKELYVIADKLHKVLR